MESFIEDLYFGTMQKQEHPLYNSDCAPKEIETIKKDLLKSLPKEFKSRFMEYLDALGIECDEFALRSFKSGFCLGIKCVIDVFYANEKN